MKRAITPLLLVFVIQCVLVAVVYWPRPPEPDSRDTTPLTTAAPGLINEILINDEYDNQAVLQRVADRWFLPELQQLPADGDRVRTLLEGVCGSDNGWPVANTIAARQRFQVADYRYQRRLALLTDGGAVETVYLGTSPAFRQVHARNDSSDNIFSIALNNHDVPARDEDWLEPKLLQIRSPLRITADTYSVHWQDGEWLAGSGAKPDKRELEALLGTLRNLQVEGVADEDTQRELSELEAELVLQVESLAGKTNLELFSLEDNRFIHSSEFNLFFQLSAYDFDRLTGIDFLRISGTR